MVTLYRGVLKKPIIYPFSVLITPENIESIDFNKIIYCEVSAEGAMGNVGGILIYVVEDEDKIITFETNVSVNKEMYEAISEKIKQNSSLFTQFPGGFGNYVFIKKDANFEIDEEYDCFWYHSKKTKLRIDSSVTGVFQSVVAASKKRQQESAK